MIYRYKVKLKNFRPNQYVKRSLKRSAIVMRCSRLGSPIFFQMMIGIAIEISKFPKHRDPIAIAILAISIGLMPCHLEILYLKQFQISLTNGDLQKMKKMLALDTTPNTKTIVMQMHDKTYKPFGTTEFTLNASLEFTEVMFSITPTTET